MVLKMVTCWFVITLSRRATSSEHYPVNVTSILDYKNQISWLEKLPNSTNSEKCLGTITASPVLDTEAYMGSLKQLQVSTVNSEWDLVHLAMELKGLRRERQHLVTKSTQRELTEWESRRLKAVEKEACDCLLEILNAKNPFAQTA